MESGDIVQLFKSLSLIYQIVHIFDKECRLQEYSFELTTWCFRNPYNACGLNNLITNFTKNIFTLASTLTEVGQILYEVIVEGGVIDFEQVSEGNSQFYTLGNGIGKIARTTLSFDKTSHEERDKTSANGGVPSM